MIERRIRRITDAEKSLLKRNCLGYYKALAQDEPQLAKYEPKREAAFGASLNDGRVEELRFQSTDGIYARSRWGEWVVVELEGGRVFCARDPGFSAKGQLNVWGKSLVVVRMKAGGELVSVETNGEREFTREDADLPKFPFERALSWPDSFLLRGTAAEIENVLPKFNGVEDQSLFDKTEIAQDALEPAPIQLNEPTKKDLRSFKPGLDVSDGNDRWSLLMIEADPSRVTDVYKKTNRMLGLKEHAVGKTIKVGSSPVALISIKKQPWTYIVVNGDLTSDDASWLSSELKQRAILIGYEPVSSGPYLYLFKDGKKDGYFVSEAGQISSDLPKAPKTTRTPWSFVEKTIKNMDVYIPSLELVSIGGDDYQLAGEQLLAERGIENYLVFHRREK